MKEFHPTVVEAAADQEYPAAAALPAVTTLYNTSDTPVEPISVLSDAEAMQDEAAASRKNKMRQQLSSIALNASVFLAALDDTIISTALPTVAADLNAGRGYTWVTGAYLLATAAAVPVITKLSDIWGRKPLMLASVALFFFSSLICALSINISMLIVGRALQGVGGGGCLAMAGVIPSDLFSQRERAMYYTFQTVVYGVASASGPPLGGVFAQEASWRWCFWINLPISGITFLALWLCLIVHNPRTPLMVGLRALDWVGITCMLGFVLMLLLALEFGGQVFLWSSSTVVCLLVFSLVVAVLFVLNENNFAVYPILPLKIIQNRSNAASIFVGGAQTFVSLGVAFFIPLYLQSAKEASPLRSGLIFLPYTIADAVSAVLVGVFINKTGSFITMIWGGTALLIVSTGLLIILSAHSSIALSIGLLIIAGVASGSSFQPILLAIHASTEQDNVAMATAVMGSARTIAGTIGIVLGGVVFQNGMAEQMSSLKASGASTALIRQYSGADATTNVLQIRHITNPLVKIALEDAFASSIRHIWILCTCVGVTGFLVSFLIQGKNLSSDHEETKTGLKPKE